MKVGVLTSSRADFGIYLPLLMAMQKDSFFHVDIIAFGTHLSNFHGYTLNQIESHQFRVQYKIDSMPLSDSEDAISSAMGLTMIKFSSFWKNHKKDFDYVFCLGDRYEMFAAVIAGIPFGIKFAHFHGGEKTMGAIDNVFRHSISHASVIHFASTEDYARRLIHMLDDKVAIYNVGSLSLENINNLIFLSIKEFEAKWGVDFSKPTILTTFHPETVNANNNDKFAEDLVEVISLNTNFQFLITMPNADTAGNAVRNIFKEKLGCLKHVFLIENLGVQSYFTAMKYCSFLLGNTSSGIIEAASFGKFVINLGKRQEGRATSDNVLHVNISVSEINKAINIVQSNNHFIGANIYYKENAVQNVIHVLKLMI